MAKVVVTKSKLDSLAQHINAKAGTTGAKTIAQMQATVDGISGGGAKETWVLNNIINTASAFSFSASFISNGISCTGLKTGKLTPSGRDLKYTDSSGSTITVYGADVKNWRNQAYRKLTFDAPPTGDLLTWLQANGVKQPDDTAIQDSKALTITSNGTVSVTPDAPYDALKTVDVTVDVASGGGGGETTSLQVNVDRYIDAPIYCLWQTSNGWMGTGNFDTSTAFTLSNVIVGGYVIFTHDPSAQSYFEVPTSEGVERFTVDAMDSEWDPIDSALVIKITAPSPRFTIRLRSA